MSTIKSSAENLTLNADGANNDIKFQSNGSEVASIDQAGTLTVGDVTAETTTGAELILSRNDTSIAVDDLIGGIQFKSNDSSSSPDPQICGIKAIATGATNANPKLCLYGGESNYNANTPQMIIDSSDSVTVGTGDLLFGTAGKGIVLGATTNVDANTLDDYEEGTWTPLHLSAGSTSDATVSHVSGIYTKVGRLVTAIIRLRTTSNGTDTGQVGISLPFTVGDNLGTTGLEGGTAVGYYYGAGLSHSALFASPVEGSAYLSLNYLATSTSTTTSAYNVNHADNIFDCRITINYMT